MNVLFVLGSFYPAQSGGPNNSIYWAAKALRNRNVNVSVASLSDGLTASDKHEYGISENRDSDIDGIHTVYFSYNFHRYLSFRMILWIFIHIKNFDVIHLNSIFFPYTWIAAVICKIHHKPYIISPRGELEPGALRFKKLKKTFVLRTILWPILSGARVILTTSAEEKLNVAKLFKAKCPEVRIFPNYIPISDLLLGQNDIRLKSGVLFLGRLHPKKGLENLIKAYDLSVKEKMITDELIIAGKGDVEYENKLKGLVASLGCAQRIKFIGHVTGDKKSKLLRSSKVLVLPSYSENFGNVVLEALASYTPAIASIYTPWEILSHRNCGLVGDNDTGSIKLMLLEYLSKTDEELYEMSMNARRLVVEEFDIDKKVNELIALYETIRFSK